MKYWKMTKIIHLLVELIVFSFFAIAIIFSLSFAKCFNCYIIIVVFAAIIGIIVRLLVAFNIIVGFIVAYFRYFLFCLFF